jgi:hypothetical protein
LLFESILGRKSLGDDVEDVLAFKDPTSLGTKKVAEIDMGQPVAKLENKP